METYMMEWVRYEDGTVEGQHIDADGVLHIYGADGVYQGIR